MSDSLEPVACLPVGRVGGPPIGDVRQAEWSTELMAHYYDD